MQFPEFCTKKARKCDTQEILSPWVSKITLGDRFTTKLVKFTSSFPYKIAQIVHKTTI